MRHTVVHRRRVEAGFTLTEMMVVVALIAILSTIAWAAFRTEPRPVDVATTIGDFAREASRKAAAGGAVTGTVVTALLPIVGSPQCTARARIQIAGAGNSQFIRVQVLQETGPTSADWVEVKSQKVPRGNAINGWRASADLNGGLGPQIVLGATDTVHIYCYPTGRCDAATLYTSDPNGNRKARTVLLPLGGSPAIFPRW